MQNKRDLIVIGGGAGGLVIASVASQLGLNVTLIEKQAKLGGDCLHHGCVPSKALIKAAKVAHLMRRAGEFGLPSQSFPIDLGKVNQQVNSIVDHIQQHDDPERFRAYGCEVLLGEPARFISPHAVQVGERVIEGRRFVIATGSRPFIPAIPGINPDDLLTNESLFDLQQLPASLAVLGGGPIGLELGQAMSRLGSQVTLLQRGPRLLAHEDTELVDLLQKQLTDEGLQIQTNSDIERIEHQNDQYEIIDNNHDRVRVDKILVATGRRPNIEGLDPERAGIETTPRGIMVDRRLRTSQKHIYACGDVAGPYAFTHQAEYQAGLIISNAVFRFPKKADYRILPWVTYTDPELAQVGLTEQQAREQGIKHTVLRFDFKEVDRALTERETAGRVKLVTRKGKILGASILGPQAGELIHELVLAMQSGAKIGDISAAIHAYPTLAQIHRRTVNTAYAAKLFSPLTRRLVRWLQRLPG
ncbi:dihydrolipoyl dehydrogenase family protein [Thiohalophilus thiocyanatoxydans]|uniref:Pyruvate/2-oxoglutarate dehydrogenase complex dihydrolipoamide dehydrogenase (E3) component n=1 Tax=Thiohalophilus thiocyanatoxydans TaxID=381308 RepID=A0A4R8IZE8_9GAMM|nr:mercuric reductase [Thiohalophilus thiocyanatoxydans]TDY02833.1 pyruvate/2-oxoglutarate dehydrogenase complex dihydrolipoamide dehydrogenase (E3) component [Thiohalophilus thiocyanatoxydans]